MTNILVVTGYPNNGSIIVETLDLIAPPGNSPRCKIPDYPLKIYGAAGGLLNGNTPVVCGGYDEIGYSYLDKCHKVVNSIGSNESWITMKDHRAFPGGLMLQPHLFWITGGRGSTWNLISTEYINGTSESSVAGPDLPYSIYGHCAVKVNETAAMLIGGCCGSKRNKTLFTPNMEQVGLNWTVDKWTDGPELNGERYDHSCGVITEGKNRQRVVIVAGGHGSRSSTELWIVGSDNWIAGPGMPKDIVDATSVVSSDETTFYIIGGYNDYSIIWTSIYQLQCYGTECFWSKLDGIRLQVERRMSVAMLVPDFIVYNDSCINAD